MEAIVDYKLCQASHKVTGLYRKYGVAFKDKGQSFV